MAQTFVPAAVARLHAQLQGALDIAVFVGEPPGADVPAAYAAVAYAGDDRPGVTGARERNPSSEHWAERFVVWCCVSTASGDQDAAAQMAVTDALFQTAAAAVAADRQLGGLLHPPGYAELGSYEWTVEGGGEISTVFWEVVVSVKWGM